MTDEEALKEPLNRIDQATRAMEGKLLGGDGRDVVLLHDGEAVKIWVRPDGSWIIRPLCTKGTGMRGTRFLKYVAKELDLGRVEQF